MSWFVKTIAAEYTVDNSGCDFSEILTYTRTEEGKPLGKLRINIHADFYDFQSRATIEHWHERKWIEVHRVLGTSVKARRERSPNEATFRAQRSELLRVAEEVLR